MILVSTPHALNKVVVIGTHLLYAARRLLQYMGSIGIERLSENLAEFLLNPKLASIAFPTGRLLYVIPF